MAIKYKFLRLTKKDSEVEDIKDRIIMKQGHVVFFTLAQMEDNEKSLMRSRDSIEQIITPIKEVLDKYTPEYSEEEQNTIMMYREAELRRDREVKILTDTKDLTDKEIVELNANIEYSKAVMQNIVDFHPFILDITGEVADKVSEYRKAYIQYKECKDKLDEIDGILKTSEIEKAEIKKQLQIQ